MINNVYEPGTYEDKHMYVHTVCTLKEYAIRIWEAPSEYLSARIGIHFNAHEKSTVTLIHTQKVL